MKRRCAECHQYGGHLWACSHAPPTCEDGSVVREPPEAPPAASAPPTSIAAWRVAAALALACGLDWGLWAAWCTAECTCEPYRGDGKRARLYHGDKCISDAAMDERGIVDSARCAYVEHRATPVADPSDAAAYLADCARRGVEPGPLPSLSHGPPPWLERRTGGGLWWSVECSPADATIVVHVGYDYPTMWIVWGPGAGTQRDANLQACFRRAHHEVVECTLRVAVAAAKTLEATT